MRRRVSSSAAVVIAAAWMTACVAPTPRAPLPNVCRLGNPPSSIPPRDVAGYPVTYPPLSDADLQAKKARLEKRLGEWKVVLDQAGFVIWVETTRIHPCWLVSRDEASHMNCALPISPEEVQSLLKLIATEVALPATAHVVADATSIRVDVPGEPDEGRRFIVRLESVTPGKVHIQITVHPRRMSKAVQELTDDELRARWGRATNEPVARITIPPSFHPCDPLDGPHGDETCAHAAALEGARSFTQCFAMGELALARKTAFLPNGVIRRVVQLQCPGQSPGSGSCEIETALPTCIDAVTGEALERGVCDAALAE